MSTDYNTTQKNSVAEILVNKLIEQIKTDGKLPWQKPFMEKGCNYITRRQYKGLNRLLLGAGEYITVKQLKDYNKKHNTSYWFPKGTTKYIASFYKNSHKRLTAEDEKAIRNGGIPSNLINARIIEGSDGHLYKLSFVLRFYNLYNIKDIVDDKLNPMPSKTNVSEFTEKKEADDIIAAYCKRSGVSICNNNESKAFYRESDDTIYTTPKDTFLSPEHYYRTLFHEATHSTGIITRLNRSCFEKYREKMEERSKEELIAEMGSLLLASECNFKNSTDGLFNNSAAYIKGWLSWLEDNPKEVVYGMTAAEKAVDYILDKRYEDTSEEDS